MVKKRFLILSVILMACIEPAEFDVPPAESLIIIEGMISDQEGPYTVKINRALPLLTEELDYPVVTGASIQLHDDQGNIEDFEEVSPGVYQTGGAMQGVVGRSYHITVNTADGEQFESVPEQIKPVGQVTDIRFEYEREREDDFFGEVNKDYFNVYVDATEGPNAENYVRWRMTGTYKIETQPQLREVLVHPGAVPLKDPRPCSGFTTAPNPFGRGTIIVKIGDCTCCVCYVNDFEKSPTISDNLLASDGAFNQVKVGTVPINSATFYEKYMVTVEQMSMSRTAFDFQNLIRIQKEEASNIFQPASGELIGNIKSENSRDRVIGLFWATSITEKVDFIERSEVPYPIPPFPGAEESCLLEFENSTITKPEAW